MSDLKGSGRRLNAILMMFAFAVLLVSGMALYVAPVGRVAHATGWRLLAVAKEGWGELHLVFGFVFVVAGVIHIWLNRHALFSYIRSRVPAHIRPRGEFILGGALSVFILFGALFQIPPVSYLGDLRVAIKALWDPGGISGGLGRGPGRGMDPGMGRRLEGDGG